MSLPETTLPARSNNAGKDRFKKKNNAGKDELQFPIPDHTNSKPGDILSISVLSYLLRACLVRCLAEPGSHGVSQASFAQTVCMRQHLVWLPESFQPGQ